MSLAWRFDCEPDYEPDLGGRASPRVEFEVGQVVIVDFPDSPYHGCWGNVSGVEADEYEHGQWGVWYEVDFVGGRSDGFAASQLQAIP